MIAGLQVASCLPTTAGQVQLSGQTHQWCLVIFQSKYLEENASIANNYSASNIALCSGKPVFSMCHVTLHLDACVLY